MDFPDHELETQSSSLLAVEAEEVMLPSPCVEYAGFWRRFGAFVVDYAVVFCCTCLFTWFLYAVGVISSLELPELPFIPTWANAKFEMFGISINLTATPLLWLYYAVFESSSWMATPGKAACKLIVTDMKGNRISFLRASNRFFGRILSLITLGAGFAVAGVTEKKQALHDMMSGCLVVREQPRTIPS